MGFAQWPLLLALAVPVLGLIVCGLYLLHRQRTAIQRQQQQMQQAHQRHNSSTQMYRSSSRLGVHNTNNAERGQVQNPESALMKEPIHQVMYQHWRSQNADPNDLERRMQDPRAA